jgi:hypothetical protein
MSSHIVATITDPDGRDVELTTERWAHIVDGHPELAAYQSAVLDAVRSPTKRLAGRAAGEEWFYRQGVGPSRWLKVVVGYGGEAAGQIVTAFARRSEP